MAKENALGGTLLLHGNEVGEDVGSVPRIACPVGVQDLTGLPSKARETGLLIRDGFVDFTPHFNPAAGRIHEILSALPRTDIITTYMHRRDEQGTPAACLVGKQINYDANRAQSGELTWATSTQGNGYGLEWCDTITPTGIHTSSGAEATDGWDNGAATAFGLQAYLQVLEFTGTSATITVQQSSDDGAGDAYADITDGGFAVVTGTGAERIATSNAQAVEQWLRLNITGTYSNLVLAVMVNRNPIAGVSF